MERDIEFPSPISIKKEHAGVPIISRFFAAAILFAFSAPAVLCVAAAEPAEEDAVFFEQDPPDPADNCYRCHTIEKGKSKGGLLLDTREGLIKGGDGPVVKIGDPDAAR